jgi:uncharacterized tellurite resistance protein B-like protein
MLSPQHALIYTMVIVAEADADISVCEATIISDLINHLPVFDHIDREEIVDIATTCSEMIGTDAGLAKAFAMIRDALSPTLREAAYALACDVMASDRRLNRGEVRMLERVRDELGVQPGVADLLEGATRIRFQAA